MLALQPFKQTMAHAAREGYREASPLTAYKLDDNDGVAKALDFHAAMLNKVDYFLIANHNVQLIELSDLDVIARENHSHIRLNNPDLSAREKNQISKELWREPKHEFMKKWSGSIAVVERCYRKVLKEPDANPNYALLIVCRNHTDVRMLEALKNQLAGSMGVVNVCTTENLSNFVLTIDN